MKPARILLVDDHAVVRAGLRSMLVNLPEFEVVGEGANGRECLDLCRRLSPSVLLLDMRLPDTSGTELCRQLKAEQPGLAVVFLTSFSDDQTVLAALEAGADGFLLKEVDGQDIAAAIRGALKGISVMAPVVSEVVLKVGRGQLEPRSRLDNLTRQERRVLELVATGITNKEIADKLNLSDGTVRNHLSVVFDKLGVQSRAEAAVLFVREQKPTIQ